jgi:hypothetical protein
MFLADEQVMLKVEEQLRLNCPSPESELARLGVAAAHLADSEVSARVRRLVIDVDDLIAQARWHLGHALLLMETQPQILDSKEPEDEVERMIDQAGMPSSVILLLRGYIRDADRVLYSDLSTQRRGGTVAGWVFHMMIDSAIYRAISALDRVAHILWYAANLPMLDKNSSKVRVYFRARKIEKVHNVINDANSQELLKIANGRVLEYAIAYRDGLTHDAKTYSKTAGSMPVDEWLTPDGKRFIMRDEEMTAELLFALANATYHQLLEVLKPSVTICEARFSSKSLGS